MAELEIFIGTLKTLDYLILILSLIIILFSTFKGFIQSILSMLTWIGAILISIYFHNYFTEIITNQLSRWEFIGKYLPIHTISKYIIAIPIIFFVSLYLLKKFRKFITSDLEKGIISLFLDKIFGLIYGILLSYIIFSTIIISTSLIKFNWYNENIISPLKNNSQIIKKIDDINKGINPSQIIKEEDVIEMDN